MESYEKLLKMTYITYFSHLDSFRELCCLHWPWLYWVFSLHASFTAFFTCSSPKTEESPAVSSQLFLFLFFFLLSEFTHSPCRLLEAIAVCNISWTCVLWGALKTFTLAWRQWNGPSQMNDVCGCLTTELQLVVFNIKLHFNSIKHYHWRFCIKFRE